MKLLIALAFYASGAFGASYKLDNQNLVTEDGLSFDLPKLRNFVDNLKSQEWSSEEDFRNFFLQVANYALEKKRNIQSELLEEKSTPYLRAEDDKLITKSGLSVDLKKLATFVENLNAKSLSPQKATNVFYKIVAQHIQEEEKRYSDILTDEKFNLNTANKGSVLEIKDNKLMLQNGIEIDLNQLASYVNKMNSRSKLPKEYLKELYKTVEDYARKKYHSNTRNKGSRNKFGAGKRTLQYQSANSLKHDSGLQVGLNLQALLPKPYIATLLTEEMLANLFLSSLMSSPVASQLGGLLGGGGGETAGASPLAALLGR